MSPMYQGVQSPSVESGQVRPWWFDTLACPKCRRPLHGLDLCNACGATFREDSGTPILVADDAIAQVTFRFPQARSIKTDEDRHRYIRYPLFFEGELNAPYHLDRAHAVVLTDLAPGSRVLELGCGGGQMRTWMRERGILYVGTDISKTRVFDWLQTHGGPDVLCDAHFLPFQDEQFDVVYAAAVTEHIACPIQYAMEARRVLKPGGRFLSNTAFLEPWHDGSHFHISPDGVVELLLAADLEIDAVWPGRGYHAFRAIPEMSFTGAFRIMRYFGTIPIAAYRLQSWLRSWRRRMSGKPPHSPVLTDGVVAGAVDWIARRPYSKTSQ